VSEAGVSDDRFLDVPEEILNVPDVGVLHGDSRLLLTFLSDDSAFTNSPLEDVESEEALRSRDGPFSFNRRCCITSKSSSYLTGGSQLMERRTWSRSRMSCVSGCPL
jgi:hypothetical protein